VLRATILKSVASGISVAVTLAVTLICEFIAALSCGRFEDFCGSYFRTKIRPTSCGPFLWPLAGSNGRQAFLPIGLIGPSGILQACEESGEVDADILI
jgi:hypothetical protein